MRVSALAFGIGCLASGQAVAQSYGGPVTGPNTNNNIQTGQGLAAVSQGDLGSNNTTTATGGSATGGNANARDGRGGTASVTNTIGSGPRARLQVPATLQSLALSYCGKGGGISGAGPGFGGGVSWGSMEDRCLHIQAAIVTCQVLNDCEWARQIIAIDPQWRQANANARTAEAQRAPAQPVRLAGLRAEAGSVAPSPADCRRMATALRETRRRRDAAAVAARDYYDMHCIEAEVAR